MWYREGNYRERNGEREELRDSGQERCQGHRNWGHGWDAGRDEKGRAKVGE